MSESVQDYAASYSFTKLEETARTFRRLGEAYENVTDIAPGQPGIAKQLLLVADVLDECVTMNLSSSDMDKDCSKELFKRCFMNGIRIKNVQHLSKDKGVNELALQARTVGKNCISVKKILPILTSVLGINYYIQGSSTMTINEEYKQYIFVQENRFRLLTGVARRGKGCSRFNGDNFMISRLDCGKAIAAIADGMGSGKRAFLESRMVIELMENCINAGFEVKAALDLINAAYIAGGADGVNPVTMDMGVLDCRSGIIHFIKLGAAATFIKRDSCVEIMKSTTLPLGVLEKVDYDCVSKKLYDGDYVVMISDGILDNLPGVRKEEKMAEIINSIKIRKPDAMAEEIMTRSLSCNNMKPADDMTVLVLGLFDTYDK
ncbi:MAG: SpoIIE family protein phosphatase [Lachnospira sp.]